MKLLQQISDPVFYPRKYTRADKFFLQFIRDERDLPFIYLLLKVSMLVPVAALIYLTSAQSWVWWALVIVYYFINSIYRASYGLMMHAISHRQLFKPVYKNLIYYITWFLGPFVGHTPETYFSHHIGMHHPEGNMPEDDSSTMYYQRDSFKSFLRYEFNIIFTGLHGLVTYLKRKNRKKLAYKALTGELVFFFIVYRIMLY